MWQTLHWSLGGILPTCQPVWEGVWYLIWIFKKFFWEQPLHPQITPPNNSTSLVHFHIIRQLEYLYLPWPLSPIDSPIYQHWVVFISIYPYLLTLNLVTWTWCFLLFPLGLLFIISAFGICTLASSYGFWLISICRPRAPYIALVGVPCLILYIPLYLNATYTT